MELLGVVPWRLLVAAAGLWWAGVVVSAAALEPSLFGRTPSLVLRGHQRSSWRRAASQPRVAVLPLSLAVQGHQRSLSQGHLGALSRECFVPAVGLKPDGELRLGLVDLPSLASC